MRRLLAVTLTLSAVYVAAPLAATAAGGAAGVLADCNAHGQLTHTYSPDVLKTALSTMPADVKEYTNCYDVIQRALLGQLGGSHSGDGTSRAQTSSGSFLPVPLIVVLVVLIVAGVGFGALAVRRRTASPNAPDG